MSFFLAWKSFRALGLLEGMVSSHCWGIIKNCTKPQLGIMVVLWICNYGFQKIKYPTLIYDHNFSNKSIIQLWYIITITKKPHTQFWYIIMIPNSSLIGPSPTFLKHWEFTRNINTYVLPFGWPLFINIFRNTLNIWETIWKIDGNNQKTTKNVSKVNSIHFANSLKNIWQIFNTKINK